MAHGRYPVSAYDLVRNHQTICSVDALKAPTRRCLAPALSTAVSRPDPRCTVAASQISIAPPDRGAHSPRFPSLAAFERRPGRLRACGELHDGAPSRWGCCHPHPSQNRTCRFLASGSSRESFARRGVLMDDPGGRERVSLQDFGKSVPWEPAPSIPSRQPLPPDALDLVGVPAQSSCITCYAEVGIVAPHHRGQMSVLLADRLVPVFPTPVAYCRQCTSVTFLCRHLPHHVLALARLSPYVAEAEKGERGTIRAWVAGRI